MIVVIITQNKIFDGSNTSRWEESGRPKAKPIVVATVEKDSRFCIGTKVRAESMADIKNSKLHAQFSLCPCQIRKG